MYRRSETFLSALAVEAGSSCLKRSTGSAVRLKVVVGDNPAE
jgi:hypothetical protein